jgi:intein/homing endonuclease
LKVYYNMSIYCVFLGLKYCKKALNSISHYTQKHIQEARNTTELLSKEVSNSGEVSWKRVLEITEYDELVYKLTLKYLRQKG